MPATLTYPGVYIEEMPNGVRTVTGVGTSVTAFIGYAPTGPIEEPVSIYSFADYERAFGGLDASSDMSLAVYQYFQNGGTEACIVRVANGAARAELALVNATSTVVLQLRARAFGSAGNLLRVKVRPSASAPDGLFDLDISQLATDGNGARILADTQTFTNLTMNPAGNYAVRVLNDTSRMVTATRGSAATVASNAEATSTSGTFSSDTVSLTNDQRRINVALNGDVPHEIDVVPAGGSTTSLSSIATQIEDAVHAIAPDSPVFSGFTCTYDSDANTLQCKVTSGGENASVRITPGATSDAASALKLGLASGGREVDAAAALRPRSNGTVAPDPAPMSLASDKILDVTLKSLSGSTIGSFELHPSATSTGHDLASVLTAAFQAVSTTTFGAAAAAAIHGASVDTVAGRLRVTLGGDETAGYLLSFDDHGTDDTATTLGLAGATSARTRYALGSETAGTDQGTATSGSNGTAPTTSTEVAAALLKSQAAKTGLYALEKADLFNMLCICFPAAADHLDNGVYTTASQYCAQRRAMLIIDPPSDSATLPDGTAFRTALAGAGIVKANSVAYFPCIVAPDPRHGFRPVACAPSGAIAGMIARTDAQRGVWKAPAGTDASILGALGVSAPLTDAEIGALNPHALNCLRVAPVYGTIAWGARTLAGDDENVSIDSQWKYLPVRRLALNIEESLYRGTQWVVFEPNDEPLWGQIRLNVNSFMDRLFRQGAFQGSTPREAYMVRCGSDTTTQDDIDRGVVNIIVGFAPLKPAEFVVLKIQQLAAGSK